MIEEKAVAVVVVGDGAVDDDNGCMFEEYHLEFRCSAFCFALHDS